MIQDVHYYSLYFELIGDTKVSKVDFFIKDPGNFSPNHKSELSYKKLDNNSKDKIVDKRRIRNESINSVGDSSFEFIWHIYGLDNCYLTMLVSKIRNYS